MLGGIDNRIFKRIDAEFSFRYSPVGSQEEYSTFAKNISGGGMRVSLLNRLEPGTLIDLELPIGPDIKTRCKGRIAWVWDQPADIERKQLFEAGVEFINVRLLYLGQFINYLRNQKICF